MFDRNETFFFLKFARAFFSKMFEENFENFLEDLDLVEEELLYQPRNPENLKNLKFTFVSSTLCVFNT